MRRTAAPVAIVLTSVLIGALAGCSGSSGDAEPDPADSPLTTYLAALWGSDLSEEEMQAQFEEQTERMEELTAECMAEAGFEYHADTQSDSTFVSSGAEWLPDDEEWVAQYGYGLVNSPATESPEPTEEWVDPNADYLASLSESEQQAFNDTLYGPSVPDDELAEDGSYEYDWEQSGCYGSAQHEVSQDDPMQSDEFKPLMDALQQFWSESLLSPAFDEVNEAWSSCMADAGHDGYEAQPDAQAAINDELSEYWEGTTEIVEDDPKLADLGEREIELALVDLDCREKTDFLAKQTKVQFALEEEFIAEHKAELEALKAAAEQGS